MKILIKFLKNILLFIVLIILIYPVFVIIYAEFIPNYFHKNLFYEKFAYGFSYTRFQEVKDTKNIDILFLGSSRSYRHYDPRIFEEAGFDSFNLGSSSQTFLQTEMLVDRYLDSLNPDYIVLDIYPNMFLSNGVESSLDLISNDYNNWGTLKMALELKNLMVLNTWIYAVYKEYFTNSLSDKEVSVKGKNEYISGGYVKREITTNKQKGKLQQDWELNGIQWESFTAIIEKFKKSSAKILIVHSPRNSGYNYRNGDKLFKYLQNRNIPYYDYKKLKFINDSIHFYDTSHMNQKGVDLYNKFLLDKHF